MEFKEGAITRAKEIGKTGGGGYSKYIWSICKKCGKGRWAQYCISEGSPRGKTRLCKTCSSRFNLPTENEGEDNPNWKGGKMQTSDGYINIVMTPQDCISFSSMIPKKSYVFEHRLVMARHLSRALLPWEIVHHKNGIRKDNRIENLELMPSQIQHSPSIK